MSDVCTRHAEHERRLTEVEKRLEKLREDLHDLDKADSVRVEHYDSLIDQIVASNSELTKTLQGLASTMVDIQNSMTAITTRLEVSDTKIDKLEGSVESLKADVGTMRSQGTISIMEIIKKNFVTILIALGGIVWWLTQRGAL